VTTRVGPAVTTSASDTRGPAAVRVLLPAGPRPDPFVLAGGTGIVFVDGGRVLVGLGRAVTLELPGGLDDRPAVDAAAAALAAIPFEDGASASSGSHGHGVLAFAALPFDRSSRSELVVPELVYCSEDDGTEWVTIVSADGSGLPDVTDPGTGAALRRCLDESSDDRPDAVVPSPVRLRPRTSDRDFTNAVAGAVDAIHRGELSKVVLARAVDVHLDRPVDIPRLLARWRALEPACTLFSVPTGAGQFVGASPELLVERVGDRVTSRPLAGTTDRDHDAASALPASLADSPKDTEEHRLVVDAIRAELAPLASTLTVPDRPELVHLHTITHLGTTIDGTLRPEPAGTVPSALHLVARLHPTPAVGGVPRREAIEWIARLETGPRGTYAGPVGYMDAAGDGRWMVGIRALTVDGADAVLTAGVGIVAGSDPATELAETGLKFRAVFDALAPGVAFTTDQVPAGRTP